MQQPYTYVFLQNKDVLDFGQAMVAKMAMLAEVQTMCLCCRFVGTRKRIDVKLLLHSFFY
jgi:hypothetical protein